MIPNTTPTPNELFDSEMRKMSDPELRVVMIITRATFGWIMDNNTGMRKKEDWISHSQMVEKSGKSSRAISYSIASCVLNNWIEARDEKGNMLDTPNSRKMHGKKIYYRLGKKFLRRDKTIASNAKDKKPSHIIPKTIANDDIKPSHQVRTTKETITKENIQKSKTNVLRGSQWNNLIDLFEPINPMYEDFYKNKTERRALEDMTKRIGFNKLKATIMALPDITSKPYAPKITKPSELKRDFGKLLTFYKQNKKSSMVTTI